MSVRIARSAMIKLGASSVQSQFYAFGTTVIASGEDQVVAFRLTCKQEFHSP